MQQEQDIIQRAKSGDEAAFTQIYECYFEKIYRYVALKIGNKMEAEDLAQQVFLKALQSIDSFKWRGIGISAWLFRIAHNQIVDYFRKEKKVVTTCLDGVVIPATTDGDNPQLMAEQRIDVERLMLATKKLTLAQQEVISLRFAGELSIAEAAQLMGKSEGAIKALQHSAILALRKTLANG